MAKNNKQAACRAVHFVFASGCRKTSPAEGFGGKTRGKRRGILGMAKSLRFVIPRSEATWESPVKCFEFAEIFLKFRTVLRDCHGPCGASQ